MEGRFWTLQHIASKTFQEVAIMDPDAARALQKARVAHYIERSDIEGIEELEDIGDHQYAKGIALSRLPIDPAHVETEIMMKDHAFTEGGSFQIAEVMLGHFGTMVSERIYEFLAPMVSDAVQFFPTVLTNTSGTKKSLHYSIRMPEAVSVLARVESKHRPRVEILRTPSVDIQVLHWGKPGSGPDAPETFLKASSVAGQHLVESSDVNPRFVFSDEVVQVLELYKDPTLEAKSYRVVDAWPGPSKEEVIAERGIYERP
ncbi:MAG: hypothetical protein ABJJ69_01285 [Paracoccaceae bacterium]